MVIDTSAILAVLFREPERDRFATAISNAGVRLVGSVNAFECAVVVLSRKGAAGLRELDLFFHVTSLETVSFTEEHLRLAREAYQRYGKGRHPAGLNLGDCCAYALSQHSGEPLLFKGGDFARTDVQTAFES
ncbi:MAG: type II toxin-antitoxin system VapC family toxin [Vicinamibacteria bacterium]